MNRRGFLSLVFGALAAKALPDDAVYGWNGKPDTLDQLSAVTLRVLQSSDFIDNYIFAQSPLQRMFRERELQQEISGGVSLLESFTYAR